MSRSGQSRSGGAPTGPARTGPGRTGDTRTGDSAFEDLLARIQQAEFGMQRAAIRSGALGIFSSDLTMQQIRIVLILAALGDQSSHSLADAAGIGATTLTGIVDRLEARGLVRRVADPHDRRVRRIELAEDGQRMMNELHQFKSEHQRRLFERLSRADLEKFADSLEALELACREEFPD